MAALLKEQSNIYERMKKSIRNYKKDSTTRKIKSYFEMRIQLFSDLWYEFATNHKQILAEESLTGNEPYFENDLYQEVEEYYIENLSEIKELYSITYPENPLTQSRNTQQSNSQSEQRSDKKLPTIKLPIFTGKYEDWASFRDLFSCLINNNESLSNVQRLYYLKTHVSGEADQLIKHYQVTDANYSSAWDVLKQRFENTRIQTNSELRTLLSQPKINIDNAHNVKSLVDTSERCVQSLSNLGVPVDKWDAILVYILSQKLAHETLQLWEQSLVSKTDVPTFDELKKFLVGRFRTLEAISSKGPTYGKSDHNPCSKTTRTNTHHAIKSENCPLCDCEHKIAHCQKFTKLPRTDKLTFITNKKLCYNCFSSRHHVRQCPSKFSCCICKKRHHTQLHEPATQNHKESDVQNPSPEVPKETSSISAHFLKESHQGKQVLLSTALVKIFNPGGSEIVIRALLDQGSQSTFITERLSQILQLQNRPISALISGIGKSSSEKCNKIVTFGIKSMSDELVTSKGEALVLKTLTNYGQNLRVHKKDWNHLQGLTLADPYYAYPGRIDMIIGADLYPAILSDGIVKGPELSPIAQNTKLGWVLAGPISTSRESLIVVTNLHSNLDLHKQLQTFWELEEVPKEKPFSKEDLKCEEIFKSTCVKVNNRYQISLPFKENSGPLGESKKIATVRLLALERKFDTNLSLRTEYSKCFNEYLRLNYLVEVDPTKIKLKVDDSGFHGYYLPYHSVYKEDSSTTKVRIVYNASQKTTSGISLNDKLLTGPNIQENMFALLLRWRLFRIVFTADIEKMYLQVLVSEDHTDFQRIVWRPHPSDPPKDFKLLRVTFGMDCSAYLAIRVLKQLAEDEKVNFPVGSNVLANDFYVDNLMSGAHDLQYATKKISEIIGVLHEGGFVLRKWASNENDVLKDVPQRDREISENKLIPFDTTIKTLGLHWYPKEDAFYFNVKFTPMIDSPTKRSMLSDVSKLYDPLGWITPVTVVGKILMQSLWLTGLDWDSEVPEDIKGRWKRFALTLHELAALRIPRWVGYIEDQNQHIELHVFCDSSLQAYAATVYTSVLDRNACSTHLLVSKSRIAPLKPVSIARLELCAAVLGAKLTFQVLTDLRISPVGIHAWTDSTTVLAWLRAQPSRWKPFVANRVAEIHDKLPNAQWRYVPSSSNPSDLGTRGLAPSGLLHNDLWWHGPKFIAEPKENWPVESQTESTELEVRMTSHNATISTQAQLPFDTLISKYSSFRKLIRVTAWCLRFIFNCKAKPPERLKNQLSASELQASTSLLIKLVQEEHFQTELKHLRSKRQLPASNPYISLSIFLDDDGLMRVGGRLGHSTLPEEQKHQILLPKNHLLTDLIIKYYHEKALHAGTQATLSLIRQRYWFKSGRDKVRKILFYCMVCFRSKARNPSQIMGSLPKERVTRSRPFQNVGIDFAGPIQTKPNMKRSKVILKSYLALFVCFSTKAVHLEVVSDLSTQAFLACLRRFIARRSKPSKIFCDNATNFKGCKNLLDQQLLIYKSDSIQNYSAEEGIEWHFIPPLGPHHGGLWESNIKSAKTHLLKITKAAILTFEELYTLVTQIEACLNSRPLTPLSSDPTDLEPLTPGHFLVGAPLLSLPDSNSNHMSLISRWQLIQSLNQQFWKRWSSDYLNELQSKMKWKTAQPNVKVDQLVLLKEPNQPPMRWNLARIQKVFPGPDGYVRVVEVRTVHGVYKRPISQLSPLPEEESSWTSPTEAEDGWYQSYRRRRSKPQKANQQPSQAAIREPICKSGSSSTELN